MLRVALTLLIGSLVSFALGAGEVGGDLALLGGIFLAVSLTAEAAKALFEHYREDFTGLTWRPGSRKHLAEHQN